MARELLLRIEETETEVTEGGSREFIRVRTFERTSWGIVERVLRDGIQVNRGVYGLEAGERRIRIFAHLAR